MDAGGDTAAVFAFADDAGDVEFTALLAETPADADDLDEADEGEEEAVAVAVEAAGAAFPGAGPTGFVAACWPEGGAVLPPPPPPPPLLVSERVDF